jgi:hypothetical protein
MNRFGTIFLIASLLICIVPSDANLTNWTTTGSSDIASLLGYTPVASTEAGITNALGRSIIGTGPLLAATSPTVTTSLTITNATTGTVPLVVNHAASGTANIADFNLGVVNKFHINQQGFLSGGSGNYDTVFIGGTTSAADAIVALGSASGDGIIVRNIGTIGFAAASNPTPSNKDAFFTRDAAAVIQMGADAATATAQAIKAHDGSGTDKAGANLTLRPGNGTGAGAGGSLILQSTPAGTTGSSQGTPVTRVTIQPSGEVVLAGTTNVIVFGGTNTAPVSSAAPTKWISVQVSGESAVYRLPLYE